jgi:hypothetical protein
MMLQHEDLRQERLLPSAARPGRAASVQAISAKGFTPPGDAPSSPALASGWHRSAAPAATRPDFALLLGNVARITLWKRMRSSQTFRPWTRQGSLADFQPTNRVVLGTAPRLLEVLEHAEFTRGRLASGPRENLQLRTFGRVLAFTRQAMINDDLGIFARISDNFGAAAAAMEADLVYDILTSNPVLGESERLFSSAHKNLADAAPGHCGPGARRRQYPARGMVTARLRRVGRQVLRCGPLGRRHSRADASSGKTSESSRPSTNSTLVVEHAPPAGPVVRGKNPRVTSTAPGGGRTNCARLPNVPVSVVPLPVRATIWSMPRAVSSERFRSRKAKPPGTATKSPAGMRAQSNSSAPGGRSWM